MKLLAILMSALLAFATPTPVATETLSGVVSEYAEGEFMLLETADHGTVQVNLSENTDIFGDAPIRAGDYLAVTFDGAMTASLPPQVGAMRIEMHRLSGTIAEVYPDDGSALLKTDPDSEYIVYLPDEWKSAVAAGDAITVYFNGAATMSLPPQISAEYVASDFFLTGAIDEIGDGFLILDSDGQKIQVNTDSIPEKLKVDDVIRVRYNGQMTRSIPAQVFALEIIRVSR